MRESYSKQDKEELVELAMSMWETDYENKKIRRKKNVLPTKVPVIALYFMVLRERRIDISKRNYSHPFVTSNFPKVLGLSEGWNISHKDRKYLEKDVILFAEDKKTILIQPDSRKWWESTWFNLLSLGVGLAGLVLAVFGFTTECM